MGAEAQGETIKLKIQKKEPWQNDLVTGRFLNLERKEDHTFTVNGVVFHLKHGGVHTVPRAVAEALNDAVNTKYKIDDIHMSKRPESYLEPRMSFQILTDEQAKRLIPDEKKKIIDEITSAQQGERGKIEEK